MRRLEGQAEGRMCRAQLKIDHKALDYHAIAFFSCLMHLLLREKLRLSVVGILFLEL